MCPRYKGILSWFASDQPSSLLKSQWNQYLKRKRDLGETGDYLTYQGKTRPYLCCFSKMGSPELLKSSSVEISRCREGEKKKEEEKRKTQILMMDVELKRAEELQTLM